MTAPQSVNEAPVDVQDVPTDADYANLIKGAIVNLREIVRGAKKAGLDVKLEADVNAITSGARVSRNFYPSNIDEGKSQ